MRRFTNVIFLPQTIFAVKFLKLYREAVQETDVFMEKNVAQVRADDVRCSCICSFIISFCLNLSRNTLNYKPSSSIVNKSSCFRVRDHLFSIYAKLFEKVTFLTPWYAHVRVHIRV